MLPVCLSESCLSANPGRVRLDEKLLSVNCLSLFSVCLSVHFVCLSDLSAYLSGSGKTSRDNFVCLPGLSVCAACLSVRLVCLSGLLDFPAYLYVFPGPERPRDKFPDYMSVNRVSFQPLVRPWVLTWGSRRIVSWRFESMAAVHSSAIALLTKFKQNCWETLPFQCLLSLV